MRISLIQLALLAPIVALGQLKGNYALLLGEKTSSITFERKNTFSYIPFGKTDFAGEGKYNLNADTLILEFYPYSDPEVEDCSGYELELNEIYTSQDSIKISVQVFDCHTGEAIPFSSIFIQAQENQDKEIRYFFSGFEYEQVKETGYDGEVTFALSKKMVNKVLRISSPEYGEIDFVLPVVKGELEIKAFIQADYDRIDIQGGSEKYIIVEKNQKYLKVTSTLNQSNKFIFLLRIRKFWGKKKFQKKIMKYLNLRENS